MTPCIEYFFPIGMNPFPLEGNDFFLDMFLDIVRAIELWFDI